MIEIDGTFGEGGGQILRTSLALSLVTGRSFSMSKIRAGRGKPGLMRQHLTCVNAAAEVGKALVTGHFIGSDSLIFQPETIKPGRFNFSIGSAGSCTLVLQTVLPALIMGDKGSHIILEGGTHNPYAPPFEFLNNSFLKVVNKMGPDINAILEKPGFYPAGGGKFSVDIQPAPLKAINIIKRGDIIETSAVACVANIPVSIAERELKTVKKYLGWENLEKVELKNSPGPGNVLMLTIKSKYITEVFTGFGIKGVSAEKVAKRCVNSAKHYIKNRAPVGKFLADQLLIPMAMAGKGKFITLELSRHTRTNIDIIKKFLDLEITYKEIQKNQWEVEIIK